MPQVTIPTAAPGVEVKFKPSLLYRVVNPPAGGSVIIRHFCTITGQWEEVPGSPIAPGEIQTNVVNVTDNKYLQLQAVGAPANIKYRHVRS